jgi:aminopeptidase N
MTDARVPLTKSEAEKRFLQVADVKYNLYFNLSENDDEFTGDTRINFLLREAVDESIFLDFSGGEIKTIKINGQEGANQYDGKRITIKNVSLKIGEYNRIEINFSHPYSNTGDGLHHFQDPYDHKVYVYTNLEPYNANQVFPCFDQPDLKATYTVTVQAPREWKVISNEKEAEIKSVDGVATWVFPESQRFSTYLFALIGGPYTVWSSTWRDIEFRLFARASLAKYVRSDEWLKTTKIGFEFYEEKFGHPYPFGRPGNRKYDQILVSDFNEGAMENVAAVTFSESNLSRASVVTPLMRLGTAETLLHELSHMWFGDLVTMKWWDDLWLNESFATYMAYWAIDENSGSLDLPNPWHEFYRGMKNWAYSEDEIKSTTHPIITQADDTDTAEANFDGITYGKGASVLKQLVYFISETSFRKGLGEYFRKYAFSNATRQDFLRELGEAAGMDLSKWESEWLGSSGTNTLDANYTCIDEEIVKLNLIQTTDESSHILRTHRTQIALYYKEKDELTAKQVFPITYSDETTNVSDARGLPCPALVFPNYLDYDYVRVKLDEHSLEAAKKWTSTIRDPMPREMLWDTLWWMIRDAKLSAQSFAVIAMSQASEERDELVLRTLLGHMVGSLGYMADEIRERYWSEIEGFLRAGFMGAEGGSVTQLIYFQTLMGVSRGSGNLDEFRAVLTEDKSDYRGLKIDQVRRWEMVSMVVRNTTDIESAKLIISKELERDYTDSGQKNAIGAEVSIPNVEIKKKWLDKIISESDDSGKIPVAKLRIAMAGFHQLGQEELTRFAINPYFDYIPKFVDIKSIEYQLNFARLMFPNHAEEDIVAKTDELLRSTNLPDQVSKPIKAHKDLLEKRIVARSLSQKEQ